MREYERTVTTVANATLRPVCRAYLRDLDALAEEAVVMTSAGGLLPVEVAAELPGRAAALGPGWWCARRGRRRGGVRVPRRSELRHGWDEHGRVLRPRRCAGARAGTGGRRVPDSASRPRCAHDRRRWRLDRSHRPRWRPDGGAMERRRGPRSGVLRARRRRPHGDGRRPRARPDRPGRDVPGPRTARPRRRSRALATAGVDAAGVVAVVDAAMEAAVRVVTVARGIDPRDLALVAFGGAGPLHACAIAEALDMPRSRRAAARGGTLCRRVARLAAAPGARAVVAGAPRPRRRCHARGARRPTCAASSVQTR